MWWGGRGRTKTKEHKKKEGSQEYEGGVCDRGEGRKDESNHGPKKKGEKENRQHELSGTVQHADENKGKKENSF